MTEQAKRILWEFECKTFGGVKTAAERKMILVSELRMGELRALRFFHGTIRPLVDKMIKQQFDTLKSNQLVKDWIRNEMSELATDKDYKKVINESYVRYKIK